jgi:mRNA interferase YafQ
MLGLFVSSKFKKDIKLMKKRHYDFSNLKEVIRLLSNQKQLDAKYRNHSLKSGEYKGYQECHISPDWLFVYKIKANVLVCYRTGTHSDLF